MNFLPEKKYGVPSHNFVEKKMFCAKKVTKLPDLTVHSNQELNCFHVSGSGLLLYSVHVL
jgi:hypothetical protein